MEEDQVDSFDGDDFAIPGEVSDSWAFVPSPEASNVKVEETDLVSLAKIIPVDLWKNFGRHLGVSENDIRAIKLAESQVDEHCFQLLYKWHRACESPPNFGKLIDAARLVDNHRFAEKIEKIALDKIDEGKRSKGVPIPQLTNRYPRKSQSEEEQIDNTVYSTNPLRGTPDLAVKDPARKKVSSPQSSLESSHPRSWESGSKDKSTDVIEQSQTSDSSSPPVQHGSFDSVMQTEGVRKRSKQCDPSNPLVHHGSLDSATQAEGSVTVTVSDVLDPNQHFFSSGHHSSPAESDHLGQVHTPATVKQQLAASNEDSYKHQQHAVQQDHQNVSQQRNFPGPQQQEEVTSKGITDKDLQEPSNNSDSPNPNKDKTELIFGVLNFTPFSIIDRVNKRGPLGFQLLWVLVGISVIIQLLATSAVSYYPLSSHQRGFTLALFLPLVTRLLPRCIFPAVFVWYVVHIVGRRIYTPDSREVRFRKEIEQSGNKAIVIAVTKYFFTDLDVSQKNSKQVLTEIQDRLCTDLNVMLVTSIVKGVVFPGCLYLAGAFYYPEVFYSDPKYHSFARVAGVFDSLSLLLLICCNGIGFAFFFHEISIRHLIACVLKIPECTDLKLSDKLNRATKTTLNCLLNDWSKIEILLSYSIVGYSLIVVSLASAGIGLSNGIEVDQTRDFRTFWLVFIVLFMVYHFLSTAVYYVFHLRLTGTVLECLVFFVLLFHVDSVKFGPFLQILHILYPGAYLFWYVVSMMYHERMILDEKIKTSIGKAKHERRFIRNVGLCCLLCLSMFLVICNEYHHLGSPKAAKAV